MSVAARAAAHVQDEAAAFHKAALRCLTNTITLIWNQVRFPPGNAVIAKSVDAWKVSLHEVLALRSTFLMTLLKDQLYFEDTPLGTQNEKTDKFVEELMDRRIRKIIFRTGVDERDLTHFAAILSGKAADLLQQGGPVAILRHHQVRSIEIVESRYVRPEDLAEAGMEHWEEVLIRADLTPGEILALLSGRGRAPRLLSDEILLLVDAMKDPRFLAQLILRVAADDDGGQRPSAAAILRIVLRVQSLLVVNSGFDPDFTPGILAAAIQSFPRERRLELLAERIRVEAAGTMAIDDALFGFRDEEYAELFASTLVAEGDVQRAAGVRRLGPTRAAEIARQYRDRLAATLLANASADAPRQLASMLARPFDAPVGAAPEQSATTGAADDWSARAIAIRADVDEGYTWFLLHGFATAAVSDPARAIHVFNRLLHILGALLEGERVRDAFAILSRVLAPALPAPLRVRLADELRRSTVGEPLLERIVHEVVAGAGLDATTSAIALEVWQDALARRVIERVRAAPSDAPSASLKMFVAAHAAAFMPLVREALEAPAAAARMEALEIVALVDTADARALAVDVARTDPHLDVRRQALLLIARHRTPAGVELALGVARGEVGGFGSTGRALGVHVLGRMRCTEAVPLLEQMLARRNWVLVEPGYPLKAAAALALADIGTSPALTTLRARLPAIRATRLSDLIDAVDRFVGATLGRFGALLKRAAVAVLWLFGSAILLPVTAVRSLVGGSPARSDAGAPDAAGPATAPEPATGAPRPPDAGASA